MGGGGDATGSGVGVGIGDGCTMMGGGSGPDPPPGFPTTPPTMPAAAAPPAMTATIPTASPDAAAAKPAGSRIEAPVEAEKIVMGPGGPNAATLRSPQSALSVTTTASISRVWLSSNSVVVDWT
jgi:hypothetical protein